MKNLFIILLFLIGSYLIVICPWKPGFSHNWVIDRQDHDNLLPWPIEFGRVDRYLLNGEYCGCGCRNIRQLKRWFTKREYKTLKGYGYSAVMMEVNRVLVESETQLVFGRAKKLNEDFKTIKLY
jgi:hypothetical protein